MAGDPSLVARRSLLCVIRGATAGVDTNGNLVNYANFIFHSDVGVGLRFDVPQLGLRTIRLDFAKGSEGTHTAFGIGQSF